MKAIGRGQRERRPSRGPRGVLLLIAAGGLLGSAAPSVVFGQAEPSPVSFARQIHPILMRSCARCHAGGKEEGGFSIESRERFLLGSWTGPVVIEGQAQASPLMALLTERTPGVFMPKEGPRLSAEEIELIAAWIDQNLPWEATVPGAAEGGASVLLRRVEPPPARGRAARSHPIDGFIGAYLRERALRAPKPVDDAVFLRRVWLDTVGLPPGAEAIEAFSNDRARDKRPAVVANLLARRRDYAEHWMSLWNDLLRNDFAGTGYIDGGRKQITAWLFEALATNRPFDRFVRELIDPSAASEGFIKGIVWRGVVNASQTPEMQAAQNLAQVFLGTNLKCASCHDSFINAWKLRDAYGLAAVFAERELEMVRCDAPTGRLAAPAFLYPELGAIAPELDRPARIQRLAEIVTSPDNGRLARTIVNRLWQRVFGRGLVEPVDDLDQPAWQPELLDWLAADFVDHGFDLKRALSLMLTSEVYQWPAVPWTETPQKDYVFRGPAVRRLTAEQFLDSVASLTGVWPRDLGVHVDLTAGEGYPEEEARMAEGLARARWIWNDPAADRQAPAGTIQLRRSFPLEAPPDPDGLPAFLVVACDNRCAVYLNGQLLGEVRGWQSPKAFSLDGGLSAGANLLAVEAHNNPAGPAGVLIYLRAGEGAGAFDLVSDESWRVAATAAEAGREPPFDDSAWKAASVLGSPDAPPWRALDAMIGAARLHVRSQTATPRAWRRPAAPLARVLGRPNREQVVTTRPVFATTLQGLALTNGEELAGTLAEGAARWVERGPRASQALARRLFFQALGREPSRAEARLARDLIGDPPRQEGVEDLLWILVNHPEFQFIY